MGLPIFAFKQGKDQSLSSQNLGGTCPLCHYCLLQLHSREFMSVTAIKLEQQGISKKLKEAQMDSVGLESLRLSGKSPAYCTVKEHSTCPRGEWMCREGKSHCRVGTLALSASD